MINDHALVVSQRHLHLLLNFLLSCIALSSILKKKLYQGEELSFCSNNTSYFLHLVLKFSGIFIIQPILLLQLLHHGRLLLVTFACGLFLFYPVLVPDILTNLQKSEVWHNSQLQSNLWTSYRESFLFDPSL